MERVPQEVKAEDVWKFYGYRKALFFYDLCWRDCEQLLKHPLGRAVVQQLIRSADSVGADIKNLQICRFAHLPICRLAAFYTGA